MFSVIKQFYDIFTPAERRAIFWLFFPMVFAAIMNVIGIAFVVPFIAIVTNPTSITTHGKVAWLYQAFHFTNTHQFLLFLGVLVLIFLTIGNGIGAFTTWLSLRFTNMRNFSLSKRLLENYLKQPYAYFLDKNSNILAKNILSEVSAVVTHVLRYLLDFITKSIAMLFIVALLFIVNPMLAISVVLTLGGAYSAIYASVRRQLGKISHLHIEAQEARYRIAHEALSGIKEIKLQGSEKIFLGAYEKPAKRFAHHEATGQIIADLPRYLLEIIAFGGIVLIILYLLATHHPITELMPLLALYAFAGYRLMPGLQAIFGAMTSIKAHADTLKLLHHDLVLQKWENTSDVSLENHRLPFREKLELRGVKFIYPQSKQIILDQLNLSISVGESVGIVGETGAGKTTVVDIILGLLEPIAGKMLVDNTPITQKNAIAWQKNLGYVPQHIYLSDDTVLHNIAFGFEQQEMDVVRVKEAAQMAAIHDFIENTLPQGYDTLIGENGIRLSGGQRQRLGIARALYHDPSLLVLDEATSALDHVTEENIMRAIYHLSRQKTIIIIAHRLSTLMGCDKIYLLQKGAIQDVGSYSELISRNEHFQRLAKVIA